MKTKFLSIFAVVFLIFTEMNGQNTFYGEEAYEWENLTPEKLPEELKKHTTDNLVCIREKTNFYFYSTYDQKIVKNILFKINTIEGLNQLQNYSLPESFDIADDAGYYKQGRRSKIKSPYIAHYKLKQLAARKMHLGHWAPVSFKYQINPFKWISQSGEFINDELTSFKFDNIQVGDVIEIYYEAEFGSTYGSNLFYFYNKYPKLSCEYNFEYSIANRFADYSFVLPINVRDSLIENSSETVKDKTTFRKSIHLTNIEPVSYPENAFESKQFPYVYSDFRFFKIISGSYPDGSNRIIEYDYIRPKNFEWLIISDTTNSFTKIYDKQSASIRQFISKLPTPSNDSTKVIFLKALCDTLNNFNFINSNNLFYNRSELYNLYSGDHLLKRRLVEHLVWKLTKDILNESKMSYYMTNIQDNRYGEHSMRFRANYSYENYLVAIPANGSYIYFVPRTNGVSYNLNELPFYYEGSLAALYARNFQQTDKDKESNYFKLIKTHKGTSTSNSRTENATINVNTDSLIARLSIKESLSGQFSTVLRHYYLNTFIDSTISPIYFKKCTEKPNSSEVKIKLSSKINEYPFRYNFNCAEKIKLETKKNLNLKNWFSFIISYKTITERPKQDYYFDFECTDAYNYLINFNKPTEIANVTEFKKEMDNETFSLTSEIVKQSESTYLLKVEFKVKTRKLEKANAEELIKLTNTLRTLNEFSLELK